MSVTLKMGVVDVPYQNAPSPKQRKTRADTVTTGQVAEWLEEDYAVMQTFVDQHADDIIAPAVERSIEGAMENLLMGGPVSANVLAEACSEIEHGFQRFIESGEMDKLGIPGVPTQAAQDRASGKKRSSRMKNKKKRGGNARAVSFYDTGLYVSSTKVWAE